MAGVEHIREADGLASRPKGNAHVDGLCRSERLKCSNGSSEEYKLQVWRVLDFAICQKFMYLFIYESYH